MSKKLCLFFVLSLLSLFSIFFVNLRDIKAELDPEVYAWETDGGATLFTNDSVKKTNGEVSFVAEMGFLEDPLLPNGVEIGFGISDSVCKASNYPYMSSSAIFFSHLASASYRIWNGGEIKNVFSSKKEVSDIYKAGNKIKVEIKYKDGVGTSYNLYFYNSSEYELIDSINVGETEANLKAIEDYHFFLCVNNASIIKFYDLNVESDGNKCDLSVVLGNTLSFELVDAGVSKYNVSFVSDGVKLGDVKIDKNRMLKPTQLPIPTEKEGKVFSHWSYANGDRFNISDKITSDTTLYATYRDNTGKCGITNIWRCAYDGQWGLQIKFDTYIPNADGINLSDFRNENEKMYVTVDEKMPVWHQMRYEISYEIHETINDLKAGVTSNANSFIQWIDANDFKKGADSLILSFKEGASVGKWGEKLDRDFNVLIVKDKSNQSNVIPYVLNEIVDVKPIDHYIEIDFSYYVLEDLSSNLESLIKINGSSLLELGSHLIYADGQISKRVLIDLDKIGGLNAANTLTIQSKVDGSDEYVKVNQYMVNAAIHTIGCSESVLSIENNLYSTYFGYDGNEYKVDSNGSNTLSLIAELNQELRTGDEIDLTKLNVKEYKFDGTGSVQDLNGATINGYDKTKTGEQLITIMLSNSKTVSLKVNVLSKITDITVEVIKKEFKFGDSLNEKNFKVYETLDNGVTGNEVHDFTVSGYDESKIGNQEITIKYQSFEKKVMIKVIDSISSYDLKLNNALYCDSELNEDSFTIDVIYESGNKESVKKVDAVYGFKKGVIGKQDILITFGNNTISLEIDVLDRIIGLVLVSIDSNIIKNHNIDLDKLDCRYLYASGKQSDRIDIKSENIKNFDSKKEGLQLIEIEADGFNTFAGVYVNGTKGCKNEVSSSIVLLISLFLSTGVLVYIKRRNEEVNI